MRSLTVILAVIVFTSLVGCQTRNTEPSGGQGHTEPSGGQGHNVGIMVKGDWNIEIRNADGTVDAVYAFENDLQSLAPVVLAGLINGELDISGWGILLESDPEHQWWCQPVEGGIPGIPGQSPNFYNLDSEVGPTYSGIVANQTREVPFDPIDPDSIDFDKFHSASRTMLLTAACTVEINDMWHDPWNSDLSTPLAEVPIIAFHTAIAASWMPNYFSPFMGFPFMNPDDGSLWVFNGGVEHSPGLPLGGPDPEGIWRTSDGPPSPFLSPGSDIYPGVDTWLGFTSHSSTIMVENNQVVAINVKIGFGGD